MDNIREEICESQKVRSDYLKWKIILIAGIGAASLGFTQNFSQMESHLLLCFIPFVCIYVDTLCRHLSIRIIVIGTFLEKWSNNQTSHYYEKFSRKIAERKIFSLESFVINASTMIISFLIILIGVTYELRSMENAEFVIINYVIIVLFIMCGICGITATIITEMNFNKKNKIIKEEVEKFMKNNNPRKAQG